ncbi:hypothetical protein EVAR_73167_1, partial [Eumeta japonica]
KATPTGAPGADATDLGLSSEWRLQWVDHSRRSAAKAIAGPKPRPTKAPDNDLLRQRALGGWPAGGGVLVVLPSTVKPNARGGPNDERNIYEECSFKDLSEGNLIRCIGAATARPRARGYDADRRRLVALGARAGARAARRRYSAKRRTCLSF